MTKTVLDQQRNRGNLERWMEFIVVGGRGVRLGIAWFRGPTLKGWKETQMTRPIFLEDKTRH